MMSGEDDAKMSDSFHTLSTEYLIVQGTDGLLRKNS